MEVGGEGCSEEGEWWGGGCLVMDVSCEADDAEDVVEVVGGICRV